MSWTQKPVDRSGVVAYIHLIREEADTVSIPLCSGSRVSGIRIAARIRRRAQCGDPTTKPVRLLKRARQKANAVRFPYGSTSARGDGEPGFAFSEETFMRTNRLSGKPTISSTPFGWQRSKSRSANAWRAARISWSSCAPRNRGLLRDHLPPGQRTRTPNRAGTTCLGRRAVHRRHGTGDCLRSRRVKSFRRPSCRRARSASCPRSGRSPNLSQI